MSPSRSTSHASSISSRSPSREGRPPTPRHPPEFSPTLPATGEDLVDDPPNLLDVEGLRQKRQRSEEHTSELQSPCNLVCRLLLEKKKRKTIRANISTTGR